MSGVPQGEGAPQAKRGNGAAGAEAHTGCRAPLGTRRGKKKESPIHALNASLAGSLCAAIVFAGSPRLSFAESTIAAGVGRLAAAARLDITVRVPAILRMHVLQQRVAVMVTGGEAVRADHAVELEVLSNLRHYAMRFELLDPDVVAVEVEGLGAPLTVGPEGAMHQVDNARPGGHAPRRHILSYRIVYGPGTKPGPRAVPIRISAQAH